MSKKYKKIGYGIGFLALTMFFVACSSEPIVIGETAPGGLFEFLFVYPISWLIDTIFKMTNNGGVAIFVATLIIIVITAPIEVKSQLGLKKQQEIQPELQKLKEKYPDYNKDPQQQQAYFRDHQKIMAQNGGSIAGGCLPTLLVFLQMPIIIALSSSVSRLTSLNTASFKLFGVLYNYGQPDPGIPYIPYIGNYLRVFIIASLIAMFLSQYFSLPKDQRDPRKNQQAMTMYMMNIIMIVMFWGHPIALAMYWTISSLGRLVIRLTITNKIIKREHEKFLKQKREEKGKRYK